MMEALSNKMFHPTNNKITHNDTTGIETKEGQQPDALQVARDNRCEDRRNEPENIGLRSDME